MAPGPISLRVLFGFAAVAIGLASGCAAAEDAPSGPTAPGGGTAVDARPPPQDGTAVDAGPPSEDGTADDASPPPEGGTAVDARPSPDANPDVAQREGGAQDAAAIDDRRPTGDASPDDARSDAPSGMRCNGHEALCDCRFDQVVFPTTHNAMSNSTDGWIAPNQTYPIVRQLADGIRGMLLDTYSYQGSSFLCHSSCLLGSKRLSDALREIVQFLRDNPNEVLAFVIEDHISAADTDMAFVESGLADLVYVHAAGAQWPTLRTMIASGRRVFVGAEMGRPPPAYYHHFYDLAWDTPYTFRSTNDFSCAQNRGSRTSALFLLNHWVENPTPSEALSRTANARDVLLGRARQCQTESGKLPNLVAVNHYSVGDLFQVVRELNGI